MRLSAILFVLVLVCGGVIASAQEVVDDPFSPEIEAEARDVGKSLRCVVCQNQSIEDSGAPLAADMRQLVRERLSQGDSPDQVRAYMTSRYGNFVLMKPPLQADTLLLWFGPLIFILLGAFGWFVYLRPRRGDLAPVEALSQDELERLSVLAPAPAPRGE